MANMKFTHDELRVIKAALRMTGGNEINDFVYDKIITEEQCNSLYNSVMDKINQRLIKKQPPTVYPTTQQRTKR